MTTNPHEVWAGNWGDDYTRRQTLTVNVRQAWLERALQWTENVQSVLELGAGAGDNLHALRNMLPDVRRVGVELNDTAFEEMRQVADQAHHCSIIDYYVRHMGWGDEDKVDLVMTRGVLIHIPPRDLPVVYHIMHEASRRYILIAEYYNPSPVEIEYRGRKGLLWKRDFAGEMMDAHPDLFMRDYGFVYHRDPEHPQDDITWFLMEKKP